MTRKFTLTLYVRCKPTGGVLIIPAADVEVYANSIEEAKAQIHRDFEIVIGADYLEVVADEAGDVDWGKLEKLKGGGGGAA